MPEYKKQTDQVHNVNLDSKIIHAYWINKIALVGEKVSFGVWTHFVGNGSDIEIKVEDKKNKTVAKLRGKVFGDQYMGTVVVPEKAKEEINFTAKLLKHGLEKKSGILKVIPPILIKNMKWGQKEARRGNVVKLIANVENIPDGAEVMIFIYEYDRDGAHDLITRFPCCVENKKIEVDWEYEYHQDTDEIPNNEEMKKYGNKYNPPEYFWVAQFGCKRFGEKQESGLLEFKDWLEIKLRRHDGSPHADEEYVITLADNTEKRGNLDQNGYARIEDIPPGPYRVRFPKVPEVELYG